MNPEISDAMIASGFDNMMEKIVADLSTKFTPDMFVDAVCQAYLAGFRSACEIWRASQ